MSKKPKHEAHKKTNHEAHVFYPDTRFERQARRPGGVLREKALQRAQASVDEMKVGFPDWLDRELQELSAMIAQLNSEDKSALDRAYLSCAQLRDVGATMGYELVTFVAKNLCDILDALKAVAIYDKNMIDCHVNALYLARTEAYRSLRPEQVPEMALGLRRVVELASTNQTKDSE